LPDSTDYAPTAVHNHHCAAQASPLSFELTEDRDLGVLLNGVAKAIIQVVELCANDEKRTAHSN
jgi:hypothetical protein